MVFSSLFFLYIFLPISIILYFSMPNSSMKKITLTLISLVFYAWGEPVWVALLVFSSVVDYVNGRVIGKHAGKWQAKAALISSVVINLSLLAVFKYLDFALASIGWLFKTSLPMANIALPIGISFYTFQTLSYTIDVYRGKVAVQRSFMDFLLFVSLFPQLIAGPILRYADLEKQLNNRVTTWEDAAIGVNRFAVGLGKKVLLANVAGKLAADLLDNSFANIGAVDAWFGIIMFAFQIYFDFSGYSDMAIGLGRIFGFKYNENFNYPYISQSITDFWRRWHISLGSFFKDYVYIPLGGNRKRQIFNLFVVWGLTGLWHGASWNFVLWGLYYGILLVLEKFVFANLLKKVHSLIRWMYSMVFVVIGWALFYFTDMPRLTEFFKTAFGRGDAGILSRQSAGLWVGYLPVLLLCAIGSTPLMKACSRLIPEKKRRVAVIILNLLLLGLSTVYLAGQSYNPFLYFRF